MSEKIFENMGHNQFKLIKEDTSSDIKQAFDGLSAGIKKGTGRLITILAKYIQLANQDIKEDEFVKSVDYLVKTVNSTYKINADAVSVAKFLAEILSKSDFIKKTAPKFKGRSSATIDSDPEFSTWSMQFKEFLKKNYPNTIFGKM